MKNIFKFWFIQVSRGYSLPMSITNWLVVFSLGIFANGNIIYGIIGLVGFIFAHLGTNVFDDVVDQWLKIPKQKYKSVHLDNGQTSIKSILKLAIIYFFAATIIGIFLTIKCGYLVAILAMIGGIIALLYPKLNNYVLGEISVGLIFGPLLFMGIYYIMTATITKQVLLLSIPVGIFTIIVLMVHSLMDYDFDLTSGKKTLVIVLGSKLLALNIIFSLIIVAYFVTLMLIVFNYLPITAGASFGTIIIILTLYKRLALYIENSNHSNDDFIKNFSLAQNIGTIYCITISASILLQKFITPFSSNIAMYKIF